MSTPFIGQIVYFPWNWAPYGWYSCNGATLSIQSQPALYSLLGTTYGGDGKTTFKLPNLAGIVVPGVGTAATGAATTWTLGGVQGTETVTLNNPNQLPNHTHIMSFAVTASTTGTAAAGSMLANVAPGQWWAAAPPANATFNAAAMGSAYGPMPGAHENRQPYLVLNPCIAWDGEYPDLNY